MTNSDELAQILAGCKNGDESCFSQLVDMYASRCYGYFYRLTGDRDLSDDLLSELFAKLVQKIGSYRGGLFESWLFRIASNIFNDYLRSKQRRAKLMDEHKRQVEEQLPIEPKRSEDDSSDKLQRHLNKLDDDTRNLIILRFYSQMTLREIAESRSEPIGTTLSKLHRALKRLRRMME